MGEKVARGGAGHALYSSLRSSVLWSLSSSSDSAFFDPALRSDHPPGGITSEIVISLDRVLHHISGADIDDSGTLSFLFLIPHDAEGCLEVAVGPHRIATAVVVAGGDERVDCGTWDIEAWLDEMV
jgi:hypothetical protein